MPHLKAGLEHAARQIAPVGDAQFSVVDIAVIAEELQRRGLARRQDESCGVEEVVAVDRGVVDSVSAERLTFAEGVARAS